MKRFLSAVLALIMLIAPMGAASCFASSEPPEEVKMFLLQGMRYQRWGKIRVTADLFDCGKIRAKASCFGEDGKILRTVLVKEEKHEYLKRVFHFMYILERLRKLNLDIAHFVYEIDNKGNSSMSIYYLDSQGVIRDIQYGNKSALPWVIT